MINLFVPLTDDYRVIKNFLDVYNNKNNYPVIIFFKIGKEAGGTDSYFSGFNISDGRFSWFSMRVSDSKYIYLNSCRSDGCLFYTILDHGVISRVKGRGGDCYIEAINHRFNTYNKSWPASYKKD